MSASLNTLSGIIYQDFIRKQMPAGTSDERASSVMKVIVVISGIMCLTLVFLVEKLGGILQLSLTLGGVTNGPLLGLFTVGMLFPYVNADVSLILGYVQMSYLPVIGCISWRDRFNRNHIILGRREGILRSTRNDALPQETDVNRRLRL